MSLNWKEIDLILSELDLPGSHIQRIIQPDFSSLVLSIYRPGDPFDLYISLAGGRTRLHRLSDPPIPPKKLQRFSQFLRSHCKGARITEAYQIQKDRIVKITTTSGNLETIVWIRLWGGAANIVVTDGAGVILDAFYRRPGRGEVSGGSFDPEAEIGKKSAKPMKEYEVRTLPGTGDFNARIEAFYRESTPRTNLETIRVQALAAVERRESRFITSLENLARQRKANENAERYRQLGDLIMSNLHALREGERCARVANYYDNNQPIEIELDPTLRPEQNAEAYYERYKKAKSGARKLREEIAEIETALRKVRLQRRRILESDGVEISTCFPDSTAKGKANQVKDGGPGLHFQSGGHRILVGRSAAENEALLRNRVRGNDLWLHTRDYPGSYVFIRTVSGKSVPLEVLLDAGNLALHYSKARNGGQAELYYTQVKYLRRPKKGKRGLVLPTHEKNLLVRRDPKRLDRLFRVRAESETGF